MPNLVLHPTLLHQGLHNCSYFPDCTVPGKLQCVHAILSYPFLPHVLIPWGLLFPELFQCLTACLIPPGPFLLPAFHSRLAKTEKVAPSGPAHLLSPCSFRGHWDTSALYQPEGAAEDTLLLPTSQSWKQNVPRCISVLRLTYTK